MRSLALLLLLAAGGCCPKPAPEIRYVTQRVEVPVVVPAPAPPVFERQPLPAESIPDGAPPQEVIRLLIATIVQLQGEVKQRDEALDAYRRTRSLRPALESLPTSSTPSPAPPPAFPGPEIRPSPRRSSP